MLHFLVRAFLADGIDEVIAHLTVIEAAFGLEIDYKRHLQSKPDPEKGLSSTMRVATRLSTPSTDLQAASDYLELVNLRSAFIHGRAGMQKISTLQKVRARSLARRATCALVTLSTEPTSSREAALSSLLAKGTKPLL